MLAVIVGGGRGGSYLAQDLQAQGYQVRVIDRRPEVVAKLRQEIEGEVICGDGCNPQILDQVGAAQAGLLVALAHDDEDNLGICRLAKHQFKVPRVITRVNNPRNEWLYTKAWGVDVAISQVHLTAKVIEEEIGLGEWHESLEPAGQAVERGSSRRGPGWESLACVFLFSILDARIQPRAIVGRHRLVAAQHLEGGPQAQLYVNVGKTEIEIVGRSATSVGGDEGNVNAWPIPIVLGVRQKSTMR